MRAGFLLGSGRGQGTARQDKPGLVGDAAKMDCGSFGYADLLLESRLLLCCNAPLLGRKGALQIGYRALKAIGDFLELRNENFGRVDGTPGIQVIVGEADHGGLVASRLTPEQIGRADLE